MKVPLSSVRTARKELVRAIIEQARRGSSRAILLHGVLAERLGLNVSDHKCADLLFSEPGPHTPGRMAELTGLSTGAITGVLDRLERAGFIVREADPQDRRRTLVRLRAAQAPTMQRMLAPFTEGTERVCANYSQRELSLILRFMREMDAMAARAGEQVRRQAEPDEGELRRSRAQR